MTKRKARWIIAKAYLFLAFSWIIIPVAFVVGFVRWTFHYFPEVWPELRDVYPHYRNRIKEHRDWLRDQQNDS